MSRKSQQERRELQEMGYQAHTLRYELNKSKKTIKELCNVIILFKNLVTEPDLKNKLHIPDVCLKQLK